MRTRDVAAAEDGLADAFLAALEQWPARGIPDSPEAWLFAIAAAPSSRRREKALIAIVKILDEHASDQQRIAGERLKPMFACVHPAIDPAAVTPLLGGACCRHLYRARAPGDMPLGSPFGPGLVAVALHLRFTQAIALKRLKGLLADGFAVAISEGALLAMIERTEVAFAAQAERIAADLKQGAVIESDETGLRVAKANRWLRVFPHGASALILAEASRVLPAVE